MSSSYRPSYSSLPYSDLAHVYRIGDFTNGYISRHGVRNASFLCERWPLSIACELIGREFPNKRGIPVSSICRAIYDRSPSPSSSSSSPKPANRSELVVHLRLGDVLDWEYYRKKRGCGDLVEKRGCYYVHPLSYYARSLRIPSSVRTAIIISDPCFRVTPCRKATNSHRYLEGVKNALRRRGLSVETLHSKRKDPDSDLSLAINSPYAVSGRGGVFSSIIRTCRKRANRTVL